MSREESEDLDQWIKVLQEVGKIAIILLIVIEISKSKEASERTNLSSALAVVLGNPMIQQPMEQEVNRHYDPYDPQMF